MRSFSLMFAAAGGAFLGWLIMEPMAPGMGNTVLWSQYELKLGFVISALIGLGLGIVTGIFQGSAKHTLVGAIAGVLIGGIGGVAGILVANQIYATLGGEATGIISRTIGWSAFGAFIGVSVGAVGFSFARLKVGFIGGAIGGALGGFAFQTLGTTIVAIKVVAEGASDTGSVARAIGFVTLAACIGLMVGIVEVVSRNAWVRLSLGKNEGREWIVDNAGTLIGSDELAHIPLRAPQGIGKRHAMIHRHQGQYFISDLSSGFPTLVNGQPVAQAMLVGGEQIQIGEYSLKFLTKNGGNQPQNVAYQQPGVPQPTQSIQQINMNPGGQPVQQTIQQTQQMPNLQQTQVLSQPAQSVAATGWNLVALTGPQIGQRFPISQISEVGRESGPIPLGHDSACSRRHASLNPTQNGLEITDLGSTNGMFVNQQRVPKAVCQFGDIVTFGGSSFRVEK